MTTTPLCQPKPIPLSDLAAFLAQCAEEMAIVMLDTEAELAPIARARLPKNAVVRVNLLPGQLPPERFELPPVRVEVQSEWLNGQSAFAVLNDIVALRVGPVDSGIVSYCLEVW